MKNQTALITGCSSGIGLHLAHEFAKHGHNLVLVAPVQEELDLIREELESAHGITAYVIAKDLELETSPVEIFRLLHDAGISIDILVNNAGHGFRGKFAEASAEQDESMVRLNISSVLRLTKLFLPPMISRGSGHVLNTASIAGFEPGPMMAVYHATKAFVLSWSEALSVELKDTGVKVTILCPGATDTDFFPKADMEQVVAFQKGVVMSPQEVAKAAYEGMADEDLLVVPGVANKMMVTARRFLTEEAQAKINNRLYQNVPPDQIRRSRGDIEEKANV